MHHRAVAVAFDVGAKALDLRPVDAERAFEEVLKGTGCPWRREVHEAIAHGCLPRSHVTAMLKGKYMKIMTIPYKTIQNNL